MRSQSVDEGPLDRAKSLRHRSGGGVGVGKTVEMRVMSHPLRAWGSMKHLHLTSEGICVTRLHRE